MRRARFSIAASLSYIGLIAVGLAALRVASRLWATVAFSVAVASIVAAIALLIYRRGPIRSFCVGYALFGGTYLFMTFAPAPFNIWRDLLVTTPLLALLEERLLEQYIASTPVNIPASPTTGRLSLPGAVRARPGGFSELTPWTYWTDTDRSNPFESDSFTRIGHSLFCLGIAIGGGVFCRLVRESNDDRSPPP